jgi:hypothetical protein
MSRRAAAWLAWSLAGLSVAMFLAGVALYVQARFVHGDAAGTTVGDELVFVPFLAFPIVGAMIASRRPENPVGWICLAAGLLWMLIVVGDSIPSPVAHSVTIDALTQWIWVPPVGLMGTYLILLFPDGSLPSRRWRPLAWLSGVVMVLASVVITFAPGPLEGHPGVRNPYGLEGLEGHTWVESAAVAIPALLPVCILASALSLVLRYRRSGGVVRQQIKWVAFAASLVGVAYLSVVVLGLFFTTEAAWGSEGTPLLMVVLQDVVLLSYAGVPVAVGFAVLKYRLYDIDVIINRTLVYGSLTATLALVYFGGVATTQAIFRALTSQEKQPQLAIVVSTLAIAALFNPLRRRIQGFIDRRFYRRKYDAAKTLEAFSAKLRDETDLDALSDDLVGVVQETMQPAHVSLWLRPDTASKDDVPG